MHKTSGDLTGGGGRPRTLNDRDMQSFLQNSGLTFCELLTLARSANGSDDLLQQRLTMIGLTAEEIGLAVLRKLASYSADDVARYAKPAVWPAAC